MRIFLLLALCGVSLTPAQLAPVDPNGYDQGRSEFSGTFDFRKAPFESGAFFLRDPQVSGARSGGGWLDEPATETGGGDKGGDKGSKGAKGTPRKGSGSAANRTAYLAYQTALSTYVYGFGVPVGLGFTSPRALIATPLIVAPLAFGAHLSTTRTLDFTEAHVKATFYAPTFATYSATALSLAFTPHAGDGYRIGSLIGAAAYPAGLWYGWKLGDSYRSEPDRLDHKMLFALGYGFLGLVTPVLYFERPSQHSEDILRIGLGQSVGMAAAGHFISDYYRPSGNSSGVPLGLATHAALGGLGGVAVAAYADASASIRPWLGAAIIGSTLGVTEGVYFFHDSRDTQERSQYAALGAAGGAMMGLGIQILTYDGDYSARAHKISWASYLVGGAFAGYVATYALTGHLTESASVQHQRERLAGLADDETSEPTLWNRLSLDPMPIRESVLSRGEPALRWKVPGVTYRF
jgi:hypothetical protein